MVTLIYVRKGLSKKLFLVAFLEVKSINSILLAFSYSLHVQSCVAFVMAKYWISMEKKPGHGRNIFLVRKLEQFEMFNERITQIWGEWKLLKHKVRFGLFLAIFGPNSHFYRFLDHSVHSNERMAQSHHLHLPEVSYDFFYKSLQEKDWELPSFLNDVTLSIFLCFAPFVLPLTWRFSAFWGFYYDPIHVH